jgi:hypothetical protein
LVVEHFSGMCKALGSVPRTKTKQQTQLHVYVFVFLHIF